MDLSVLASVFSLLICPDCKEPGLRMHELESSKMGFASTMKLFCEHCEFATTFYTSKRTGHSFEVNKRIILAARNIGVGHEGLKRFATVMDMPQPMNANAYTDSVKHLHAAAKTVAENSMSKAAEATKTHYEACDDGIINAGVSGDGTWRKRGFTSSVGVVAVMSILTGKVIDTEVMSKECRTCSINKFKPGTPEFDEWWEGHQHNCHVNFEGSSGKMDPAGTKEIFSRSIDKHGLRYTEFLGDGDSKSYHDLVQSKIYGDVPVQKLECVGHIQKRMESRLRSLKKRLGSTKFSDGKSIGGKGRLTDKLIDSLQVYYGRAIRSNTHCKESMKNAVMAIWEHSRSTDASPHHELCPQGSDSWCGFQRDVATGLQEYKHIHPVPAAVAQEIKSTFEALSADELLISCLHGGTRNRNESFNSLIWQRAPKTKHSSLPTAELATYLAIGHFNDGSKTIKSILLELGLEAGKFCEAGCRKIDRQRMDQSRRQSTDKAKTRRRALRNKRKGYKDTLEDREGLQYQSGAF